MNAQRELLLPSFTSERERIESGLREAVADFNCSHEPTERVAAINRVRELRALLKTLGGAK